MLLGHKALELAMVKTNIGRKEEGRAIWVVKLLTHRGGLTSSWWCEEILCGILVTQYQPMSPESQQKLQRTHSLTWKGS